MISLRDIFVTVVIFGLLPACLMRPWIGILTWSWIGYMNPHRLTWGFAYSLPFGQLVALSTLAGFAFTSERRPLPRTREVYLLATMWAFWGLTTLFALNPDEAGDQLIKVSKILLMTFLTMSLCQDERKLRALIWVIAMSIGFFGLKGGIWAILTGAQNQVLGPPDSFIEGNTEIGLAMNMTLPLLLLLKRDAKRVWLRGLLTAMFLFTIMAILTTYARSALVGLIVIIPLLFLKSRTKILVLPVLVGGILFAQFMMPAEWFQKMDTIQTYEDDLSANQRLTAWTLATQIAKDHPFLGGGFRTFSAEVYMQYMPGYLYKGQDAHSIFFQVLGEHGFTGLALFVALIVSSLVSCRQLIRATRGDPERQWIHSCAQMVEVSMIGYLASGMFLSMSYFDLFYHLVAIIAILRLLAAPRPAPRRYPSARPALPAGGARAVVGGG